MKSRRVLEWSRMAPSTEWCYGVAETALHFDRPFATGLRSGVSVLDIDVKHADALGWWQRYASFLPPTRAFRTRSGGIHLYFQHRPGVTNKARQGVDVRGEGGFIISWFAAGLECLDHTPPALWPDWPALRADPRTAGTLPACALRRAPRHNG